MEAQKVTQDEILIHGLAEKELSWFAIFWKRFRRSKAALVSLVFLVIVAGMAIFAPFVSPYDPNAVNLRARNLAPSSITWLGTDEIGRDIFSRLVYGGRISLSVGLISVSIYVLIGGTLGAIAGFFGGAIDNLIMRIADVFLAFPFILLAITLASILGPSIENLIVVIIVLAWPVPARLIRGEILSVRERDYITAARATGANNLRIIFRHMVPNAFAPLVVQATLAVAGIVLAEASLSYLGFGVRPPTPSWGNMLASAQSITVLRTMPWQWMPPGFAIFLTVLSINFVGDALRDALDPRLKM
jgi:peptide/nickel transport system permease protein